MEDINVRNAQFKNFDTIVRMRLRPVWHKVGAKTRIHVAALTELRNLHTWLLEYDSATFASYINTLQRQHFKAEKNTMGPARHVHDWFNAKAAALLVEASQSRVSRRSLTMDNEPGPELARREAGTERGRTNEFEEDEMAMREAEAIQLSNDEVDVMETIATQTQTVPANVNPERDEFENNDNDQDEDDLQEVQEDAPPPVFRPLTFGTEDDLATSVQRRIRKNHDVVLEEQPKWALLAKVLKEVEDTITRVSDSHAGMSHPPPARDVCVLADHCRSTGNQHRLGHDRLGPNMSATQTIPHNDAKDGPAFRPTCREENDGNPLLVQLAARKEWRAPVEPCEDGWRSSQVPGRD